MSEFEIRIPARKKQPATDKDNPVVKVSPEAYNALVEIYNESTISMKDIASLLIVEGSKHVVYDKEEYYWKILNYITMLEKFQKMLRSRLWQAV